jgi:hypothetical protein
MTQLGPFFTLNQAAEYCGYSREHFGRMAAEYQLKRYGPAQNRFSRLDLDRWMSDPRCFLRAKVEVRRIIKTIEV